MHSGVQYFVSIFRLLQNCRYSLEMNAPPLSDLFFSGIPYKLKLRDRKFSSSFVSEVLQIFAVDPLLNLSTAYMSICVSPVNYLL